MFSRFLACCACLGLMDPVAGSRLLAEDPLPAPVVREVARHLQFGFTKPLTPVAELERSFQQALLSSGQSPCLRYAQVIVLSKNGHPEESLEILREVAQSDSPVKLLALEDLCLRQLRDGKFYASTRGAIDLAKAIAASEAEGAGDAQRSAAWLGRLVGALRGPLDDAEVRQAAEDADAQIEIWIGPAAISAYRGGRDAVAKEHQAMLASVTARIAERDQELQQQAQDARAKASRSKSSHDKLAAEAKEIQELVSETSGDLTSRRQAVERHYYSSLDAEQRMLASQTLVQRELDLLLAQKNSSSNDRRGGSRNRTQIEQAIQARQAELLALTTDHALLLQTRQELLQLASSLALQQQSLQAGAGQMLADKQAAARELGEWERKYQQQAARKAETAAESDPEVKTLIRRAGDWNTYLRRTVQDQRTLLETRLGILPGPSS